MSDNRHLIKMILISSLLTSVSAAIAKDTAKPPAAQIGVGAQYDTTHVYVAPEDVDKFVASFLATFGGQSTKQVVATVTPTPSSTTSQLLQTPVGTVSLFGFKTPIPYPFGAERTGYLVTDIDEAIKDAKAAGADVIVATFPDPIGRDVVIQWPGGVNMQLYWHTTKPSYAAFQTVPENRVYVSPERADAFTRAFLRFSHGKVVSDEKAPGVEIGREKETFRRIRIESTVRQDDRVRHGRSSALSVWARTHWLRGRRPPGNAEQSQDLGRHRSGRALRIGTLAVGHDPVSGRLRRRDSRAGQVVASPLLRRCSESF